MKTWMMTAALAAGALWACSEESAEAISVAYEDPRLELAEGMSSAEHPRYAMFWAPGGLSGSATDIVEQAGTGGPFEPGMTTLSLPEAPGVELLATSPGGGRYGVGRPVAYDDLNQDGDRDADEPIIGDSLYGLLYLPADLSAAASPTGRALEAGFHSVLLPLPCNGVITGDTTCGVPLGDACDGGDACGDGICLQETAGVSWSGGYCAVEGGACEPSSGILRVQPGAGTQGGVVWLRACEATIDCRENEGYLCEAATGGCRPDPGFVLRTGTPPLMRLCDDGDPMGGAGGAGGMGPMGGMGGAGGRPMMGGMGGEGGEGGMMGGMGGMMRPTSCEEGDTCEGECPAGSVGCACAALMSGMGCVPTCEADEDCPGDGVLACNTEQGLCRPMR